MGKLESAFAQAVVHIVLGQVIRQVFLRTPESKTHISLVGKLFINITIPSAVLSALLNTSKSAGEGAWLMLCMGLWLVADVVLVTLVFSRLNPAYRASTTCSSLSLGVGTLFFSIMQNIAGEEGLALLALADLPNNLFLFFGQPLLFKFLTPKPKQERPTATAVQLNETQTTATIDSKDSSSSETLSDSSTNPIHVQCATPDNSINDSRNSNDSCVSVTIDQQPDTTKPTKPTETLETDIGTWEIIQAIEFPSTILMDQQEQEHDNNSSKPPTTTQRVMKKVKIILIKTIFNFPAVAAILGLILNVTHAKLPSIILDIINCSSKANGWLAFTYIGLMLDINLHSLRLVWKYALASLVYRYVMGVAASLTFYLVARHLNWLSALGRLVLLVTFVQPMPSIIVLFAFESKANAMIPALLSSLTMVVSFITLYVLLSIFGLPTTTAGDTIITTSSSSL